MADPTAANFAAIIAAGGSGSRFAAVGSDNKPKQYLQLHGLPLFAWSLKTLASHPSVSAIVMVTPSHMVQLTEAEVSRISDKFKLAKPISVISGGSTRQGSVFNGLKFFSEQDKHPEYVMVHDAARPFLDNSILDAVTLKAIECGASVIGAAVSDTIKRVAGDKVIETLNREELVAVQTPQVARFDLLLAAHQAAEKSNFITTDDVALLEWAGHEVHVVQGPSHNMKLTHPIDLILAEALADYLFRD
ncbi:MAG: 2-C-methyl-D-erythritol 4-phosphate cytidylyltransferase [Cyanobacteria bacterium]|nr:2-C-methyl-D-erythritol 4-phosphate cytidylyltransferase [Cyanobacteriota bacterium]